MASTPPRRPFVFLLRRMRRIWKKIGDSDADRDTMLLQLEQECLDTYHKKMIWDEIGETDSDRDNMFNQLEQECHEIYRKKFEETRKHKAGFIKWLAEAESEVISIAPSLGDSVMLSRVRSIEKGTVKQKLANIRHVLEELKSKMDERCMESVEGHVQRLNELEESYRGLHMDDLIRKGKEQALTIRYILDMVETRVPLLDLDLDSSEKYNVREKCGELKKLNELAARVPFQSTIQGISNPNRLKVLLVGLSYPSYGEYQLTSSIPSLCLFREHVVGFFGYEPLEIRYVVDDTSLVPSSSSSDTFVEEFQSSLQVLKLLETMALASEEDDVLIFFFNGHGVKIDGQQYMDLGPDEDGTPQELSGYDIDKVVAKLPNGVSLYRFYDCCMAGGIPHGIPKQYRPVIPPQDESFNCSEVTFTAVDGSKATAYGSYFKEMEGMCTDFTYALVDGLISYEGTPTNLQLVTYIDRKMMERELAEALKRKDTERYLQCPGLFCNRNRRFAKFLS